MFPEGLQASEHPAGSETLSYSLLSDELEEEVRNSLKEAGEQAPPPQGEPQELLGQFIRDYHRSTGF